MRVTPEILESAPGPTPWYMAATARTIPSRRGALKWTDVPSPAPRGGSSKGLVAPDDALLVLLDLYCHVTLLAPSQLLIWFKPWREHRAQPGFTGAMRFRVIDIDRVLPIADRSAASTDLVAKGACIVAAGGDVAEMALPSDLSEGVHPLMFPESMVALNELLLFSHSDKTSLWVMHPRDGYVEVFPQDWFNNGKFDRGYQWPTRVVRDPATGQIVGDGIRIGVFVLDSTCRRVDVLQ